MYKYVIDHHHWIQTADGHPRCPVCVDSSQTDGKFKDYAPKTAFLFPGQGAQSVGMAKVGP
eukprot:scaffold178591_cov35-Prasinocladus_malaysianus.AAC.1